MVSYSAPAQPYTEAYTYLASGEEVVPRGDIVSSGINPSTNALRLTFFTARKSEWTTQAVVASGATAAVGATLTRYGLYEIDSADNGVLVAAIDNDPNIFASTHTNYTRPWITPYYKRAGQRYAFGILTVNPGTLPTLLGSLVHTLVASSNPRLTGVLGGMTDLPSTFQGSSLSVSGVGRLWAAVLP